MGLNIKQAALFHILSWLVLLGCAPDLSYERLAVPVMAHCNAVMRLQVMIV